jgi:hypothetical protein
LPLSNARQTLIRAASSSPIASLRTQKSKREEHADARSSRRSSTSPRWASRRARTTRPWPTSECRSDRSSSLDIVARFIPRLYHREFRPPDPLAKERAGISVPRTRLTHTNAAQAADRRLRGQVSRVPCVHEHARADDRVKTNRPGGRSRLPPSRACKIPKRATTRHARHHIREPRRRRKYQRTCTTVSTTINSAGREC